ncbi:MAG: GNAT family N-acetyltransferase [Deltaproteobacteria bacterium]|nr:GNAT family N-acetyltransferase [Deltaproteobacteria bacterium]
MNQPREEKKLTPAVLAKLLRPGSRIFIGSGAACPHTLINFFLEHAPSHFDLEAVHILTMGDSPWTTEKYKDKVKVNSLFLSHGSREAVCKGLADYTPCFLSEIPSLFLEGILPIDVALIQVTPPDEYGYCSLGVSIDIVSAACRAAQHIIAQINPRMPRTYGQSFIHIDKIDACIESNDHLPELFPAKQDETTLRIGQYVASLIEDGSTLQMGIGKIPDAVLQCLGSHRDLGIHTEMFSDGVLDLIHSGIINNEKKTIHKGKTITSFVIGTQKTYDFCHNNPHVEFHPSEYINKPTIIAQNDKMVAINSAIEVDLTGQVVSDSVGRRFFSGIGGQVDFIRGAAMSRGGKPIIALPSTAKGDTLSKIVPCISKGSGVVTSRGDVHYVVTEYGIATLRGRSVRERALELIQIAHPKFREELMKEVRESFWVPAYQTKEPVEMKELGDVALIKLKLKDNKEYILRPLHSSDERRLQEFFYSHNKETLLQRYRYVPKNMTRERAYDLVNVDQKKNLALCIIERQGPREVIHAVGRYFLNQETNTAESAFVAKESKRGLGMSSVLLEHMLKIATKRGIARFSGLVRSDNGAMLHVFEKMKFVCKTTDDPKEKLMELELK